MGRVLRLFVPIMILPRLVVAIQYRFKSPPGTPDQDRHHEIQRAPRARIDKGLSER